jgi:16S rRNA (cytosine1402-N4)-methyltransferase
MIVLAPPVSRRRAYRIVKTPRPSSYHEPVLLGEVLQLLAPAPGKVILDGTLGGGGHTTALLGAGAEVIGLDQDPDALAHNERKLSEWAGHFHPVRGNFAEGGELLDSIGVPQLDGVLLDLGVSSHQLDTPERGFSFQEDGPLDMRMDPSGIISAASLVNAMSADQLERIFRDYGEEPHARKIASRIARDRLIRPFQTTRDLAEMIEAIIPRRGHSHPGTRVFQALRIAVNRELEVLQRGLENLTARLAPGGVFAVITFHSLEDRIVKNFFKHRCAEWLDRPDWTEPRRNPDHLFRALTRKPLVASDEEQRRNPRSRSAKLRAVQRLAE